MTDISFTKDVLGKNATSIDDKTCSKCRHINVIMNQKEMHPYEICGNTGGHLCGAIINKDHSTCAFFELAGPELQHTCDLCKEFQPAARKGLHTCCNPRSERWDHIISSDTSICKHFVINWNCTPMTCKNCEHKSEYPIATACQNCIYLPDDETQSEEPQQKASEGGNKYDFGKTPLELLPTEALTEVGKVLAYGAGKYDNHNWRKGMSWSRLAGATIRHLFAWMEREDTDSESSLNHLAHAACDILFLLTYQILGLGTDDRYKPEEGND